MRAKLNDNLLVGAHMSIAGGMYKALERGKKLHCRTIQIFLKNSNQWKAKAISEEDVLIFQKTQQSSGIGPVVAHDSYLINLASPDSALHKKSLSAFMEEMERANLMGIPYLVMHPGSHMGTGVKRGIARVAKALTRALERVEPPVMILLENTAGQGNSLGCQFEQLAAILDQIKDPDRVGICLDTCHAFAAGYDIRTDDGYAETLAELDRFVGIEKIKVFHVNDSKKDLGSRVDRHCHIGKGFIGLEAFRFLVNDTRFADIPKILETPKGENDKFDKKNLATLRSLVVSSDQRKPKQKK